MQAAYHGESAFRQETWLAVIGMPLALWIGQTWVETALLMGSLLVVLIVELLNSAIEAAIDRISFELHDLSKHAKDLGSAVKEFKKAMREDEPSAPQPPQDSTPPAPKDDDRNPPVVR